MNIAIIGYGRMGQEVERLAEKEQWVIKHIISSKEDWEKAGKLQGVDCAIEFTLPEEAPDNILRCLELGIPVVTGTTAWYDRLDEIKAACEEKDGSVLYAPNFSKGVNVLFEMNKWLAKTLGKFEEYDVSLTEFHHIHKLDAPSGTAVKLAEDLVALMDQKKGWKLGKSPETNIIPVKAIRNGEIMGTHLIKWSSSVDSLTIIHEAKDRSIFAEGAIEAAKWIVQRKGMYSYSEMLFG